MNRIAVLACSFVRSRLSRARRSRRITTVKHRAKNSQAAESLFVPDAPGGDSEVEGQVSEVRHGSASGGPEGSERG